VPRAVEQQLDLVERHVAQLAREPARVRNANAEEPVALAVLAGTGSEESLQKLGVVGIAERAKALERGGGGWSRCHSASHEIGREAR